MTRTLRILHLEDSEPDAALVERALGGLGQAFEVRRVSYRADFVSALAAQWDLILSDHTLPDTDAPEALRLAGGPNGRTPFLVVSGTIDEETAVAVLTQGAEDYVTKSNLPRLVPAVRRALVRSEDRRHRRLTETQLSVLSQAVEQTGSLVLLTDAQGRIEYVNPRFSEVSGYSLEEVRGQTPRVLKGDTPPDVYRGLWTTVTAGHTWRGELSNRSRSGEIYRVAASISPVRDGDGRIAHYVGIQEDITAETQRQVVEAALDRVRRCVWGMRRSADVAALRVELGRAVRAAGIPCRTVSANIVLADESRCLLLATRDGEELAPVHAEGRQEELIRQWHAGGEVVYRRDLAADDPFDEGDYVGRACGYRVRAIVDVPFSHGTLAVNSDVPEAFDEGHLAALRRFAGVLSEGLGRLDDLRRIEAQERQLRQSQKMEAMGQLAGGVAHDFNNLLTVISGYAQVLRRRLEGGDAEELALISRAAESATTLVRQLLAFSRRQTLQPESVNIDRCAVDTERMLRRLLGEDIELCVELAGDACTVRVDPGQLEQVIVNLAVNARDAMPDGGRLTIHTERVDLSESYVEDHADGRPGPHVLLAVTDTGTGMDAQTQARIFEPFFTTKSADRGTGLGLATVYGIVHQSGGFIHVDSELGLGTTLNVYLPLEGSPAEAVEAGAGGESGEDAVATGVRGTVLFVEDEEMVREVGVMALERAGYRVIAAANADEALVVVAEDGPIDLLVTDLVLPGLNGVELSRRLQAQCPGLPVLLTSGYMDRRILSADTPGEIPFLAKPYDLQRLSRKVAEVLRAAGRGDATP